MSGVMGTGVNAAGLLLVRAEIARCGLGVHLWNLFARMSDVLHGNVERMHVDVAVWAVVGAKTAADAPVFDNDFQAVSATDGADRAADHAKRIFTVAAGCSHQVLVPAQTVAD